MRSLMPAPAPSMARIIVSVNFSSESAIFAPKSCVSRRSASRVALIGELGTPPVRLYRHGARPASGDLVKVLVFGATGMLGQGVLRECLLAPTSSACRPSAERPPGQQHAKLRELVHADLWNYASVEPQLAGFDACFFCLGVASAGMSEADYTRVTYDPTVAAATTLARLNPAMTFIFVSGTGTDGSERDG